MLSNVIDCACYVVLQPQTHEASVWTMLHKTQIKTQHLRVNSNQKQPQAAAYRFLGA